MKIRQVFPAAQVAHLFANQSQESARVAGGNFYFKGATAYSYRDTYAVATFSPWRDTAGRQIIIMPETPYSSTTGRHMREIESAFFGHPAHILRIDPAPYVSGQDRETAAAKCARLHFDSYGSREAYKIAQGDGSVALALAGSAIMHARKAAGVALEKISPSNVRYFFQKAADYVALAHMLAGFGKDKKRARLILADAPELPAGFLESAKIMLSAPERPAWNAPDRDAKTAAYVAVLEAAAAAIPGEAKTIARELWKRQRSEKRAAAAAATLASYIDRAKAYESAARKSTGALAKMNNMSGAQDAWHGAEAIARKQKRPAAESAKYRAAARAASAAVARLKPAAAVISAGELIHNVNHATRTVGAAVATGARNNGRRAKLTTGAIFRHGDNIPQAWRDAEDIATRTGIAAAIIAQFEPVLSLPRGERGKYAEIVKARYPYMSAGSTQAATLATLATVSDGRGKYATQAAESLARIVSAGVAAAVAVDTFKRKIDGRKLAAGLIRHRAAASPFLSDAGITANNARVAWQTLINAERDFPAASGRADIVRPLTTGRGFTLDAIRTGIKTAQAFADAARVSDNLAGAVRTIEAAYHNIDRAIELEAGDYVLAADAYITDLRADAARVSRVIGESETAARDSLTVSTPENIAEAWRRISERASEAVEKLEMLQTASATVSARVSEKVAAARADAVAHWRATGEGSNFLPRGSAYFRTNRAGDIVSSQGAQVSESAGRRLWTLIRATVAAGVTEEWPWGQGPAVGAFRVVRIGADGSAVVGCHTISAGESHAFASHMGWDQ